MPVSTRKLVATLLLFYSALTWGDPAVPRVYLVAQNSGTEITDLLVPFAILSAGGVDTEILSTGVGPVNLMSGLELLNLRTLDEVPPDGADLIVVPAVHHPDQEVLLEWLTRAHGSGATVASICDGVDVLATAGLLEGRKATGHFYSAKRRKKDFPGVIWVQDARYVADGGVFSTAGVSASAPASVELLERLVDSAMAAKVADAYGIDRAHSSLHNSSDFSVGFGEVAIGVRNWLMGLHKRKYNLRTQGAVDEYGLALTVDSIGRTYRASVAIDSPDNTIRTKHGLHIRGMTAFKAPHWQILFGTQPVNLTDGFGHVVIDKPARALARIFQHIDQEYGSDTADFVGLQLELPDSGALLH
jgi:putative intracellular protease/amidase